MKDEEKLKRYRKFKEENFWNRTDKMQKDLEDALDSIW